MTFLLKLYKWITGNAVVVFKKGSPVTEGDTISVGNMVATFIKK